MEQRISLLTLAVEDLGRARSFYERLGWTGQEVEETVFFQAGGIAIVLWSREKLAADCGLAHRQPGGFDGIAIAHNVRSEAEVVCPRCRRTGRSNDQSACCRDVLWGLRRSVL